jgi:hypothetical protein
MSTMTINDDDDSSGDSLATPHPFEDKDNATTLPPATTVKDYHFTPTE